MNCNSNKKNINKQNFEAKLKELGLSIDEVKTWLNEPTQEKPADTQMYFGFFESPEPAAPSNEADKMDDLWKELFSLPFDKPIKVEKTQFKSPSKTRKEQGAAGRVSFFPGQSADACRVSINGAAIAGVLSASLDYDAEVNMPVLHLEIYDPEIVSSLDKFAV